MVNGKRIACHAGVQRREDIRENGPGTPEPRNIKILVDDHSTDGTVRIAKKLDVQIFIHEKTMDTDEPNKPVTESDGCRADIVVMVHPDYQYTPC